MKIHKKLGIGLSLLLILFVGGFLHTKKAYATPMTSDDFANYNYTVGGFSNGKVDTLRVTIGGTDYSFQDTNTLDPLDRLEFTAKNSTGPLCGMEKGQGGDMFGIKITDGPTQGSDGKTYFQAIIGIGYSGDTTTDCNESGAQKFLKPPVDIKVFYSTSLPGAPTPTTICSTGSTDPKCTSTPQGSTCNGGVDCKNGVCTKVGGDCTNAAGPTGSNDACYNSGWEWSWAACPIITAAQTTANGMYNFVEDQLKFSVSPDSKLDSKTTDSLGKEHDSVHQVWSNFRILVSGLVVILLLIMVISQAIGTGPFDAYTVKKMLPRLVIGVILIQISWPIFSWVINTVDDMGRGLADIMYAPFGGSDALNLNSVMKPFVGEAIAFNWVGIPALAVFAVVAPFIVIGLILTVLVAIFVGFLTLLFRKIIIILALIFVPVALISWMMPNDGLRKYWKLWWDNFIKALMMFPLIVVMIAAGRIFAKIGSGQGGDFVGFFIVLVGFFGPLFILPKTFKWGGALMQSAGSAISSAGQKGLKKPKEVLQGFNERYQGKRADKYTPLETGAKGQFWRGLRRVQSGHMTPFSKRSRNLTLQAGSKWAAEQNELADAYLKKWVDKAEAGEVTPEAVDHYNQMARDMGYTGGDLLKYETFKDGGIGAAKWSTLPLMMEATRRGDDRIQKAIMRYLPRTKSLLEFANDKFMMPNVKSDGSREWLPAYDHPVMIDQAAKNPDTYDAMIAMRSGLLASHNTPHGGATYKNIYDKALPTLDSGAPNPNFDLRYAGEFAGGPGSRVYLAQQMQEISEDTLGIAAGGGNRAITFHKNIRSWADSPRGRYEDGASSSLPAEELAKIYVEASRSQAGRAKLQGLLDSPATQAEVDAALARSGHAQFRDALGDLHNLTIRDLLESGERADQRIVSGAVPAPAAGARPPLF